MHDLEFDHVHPSEEQKEQLSDAIWSADNVEFTTVGVDVSVKDGGRQIEYEDQDPRIHGIFLEEIAKNGVESGMGDYIDEAPYLKKQA